MRVFACVSAASLGLALPAAAAPPQRVASLNLCTDELLLLIADPRQISSVTHLAQNKAETPLWKMARRFSMNDGSLLSVAAHRPDLIITMGGGIRDRSGIAAKLGIKLLDLPFPKSLDDIDRSVSQVAGALGGRSGAGRSDGASSFSASLGRPRASTPSGFRAAVRAWVDTASAPNGCAWRAFGSGRSRETACRSRICW
jgi:iron complex transport system substrate-binding protein